MYGLFYIRTCRILLRNCRMRRALAICGLTLTLLTILFVFRFGLVCTGWQASAAVSKLCQQYIAGKVAGNMCQDLCVTQAVVLGRCHTYHLSKDVVVIAQWHDQKIVLKTRHAYILDYDRIAADDDVSNYPLVSDFAYMVKTMLRFNFNISLSRELHNSTDFLTHLWSLKFQDYTTSSQMYVAAVNSIWSLVQQNEYMLFKYFEKYQVFPKVIGTCGHMYGVEYVRTQAYDRSNWASNLAHALKFLELVTVLQTAFHQPLYLCDIKPEHFGMATSPHMKIIDADTAFFQSVINKMVQNGQPCSSNEECAFWDCKSKCDSLRNVCNHEVLNNNLQMMCEHLFLRSKEPHWLTKPGLLHSTQGVNRNILQKILLECANPSEETDPDVRIAASDAVLSRLRLFLRNDLSNQNNAKTT